VNEQIWWSVARPGGIVAWAQVTVAVRWGLLLSTKAAAKASEPAGLLDLHRFLGGLSVPFTALHLIGLVADSHVSFGWAEILIPGASAWKPAAVSWGAVALHLLVEVEGASLRYWPSSPIGGRLRPPVDGSPGGIARFPLPPAPLLDPLPR
jgi:hypothetical protein